jgi:transposase
MDRDVNGCINNPRVIKFKIKNGDSHVDFFSGARAAQQFNCIND